MSKIPKSLLSVYAIAKIGSKQFFRDKVAIFFTFVFPLMFLFVFGGIFGSDRDTSFDVGLINNSDTEFAEQFEEQLVKNEVFEIDEDITNKKTATEKMDRSQVDATIILPEDFGELDKETGAPAGEAVVSYNQQNEQGAQVLAAILQQIFDEISSQFMNIEAPLQAVTESTAKEGLSSFDYTFAGLLGFSILSLGIFGPTNVFPKLKMRGVLKRYHTTPLRVWQYFIGTALANMFVGILSVASMFAVAFIFFDLNMRGSYLNIAILTLIGTAALYGIGLAIGGWAKNENQAAPIAQVVVLPMMFLSGAFFPRFVMPEWLQTITDYLPLTPLIDGARFVITEGKSLAEIGPQIGALLIWNVVIYLIAFKIFRWE